ncbi:hypothetical protein Nmel_012392 [Mimus melanotis]
MAAALSGPLSPELAQAVSQARVLVVGAGGIGCELLKNLVLTGFSSICVVRVDGGAGAGAFRGWRAGGGRARGRGCRSAGPGCRRGRFAAADRARFQSGLARQSRRGPAGPGRHKGPAACAPSPPPLSPGSSPGAGAPPSPAEVRPPPWQGRVSPRARACVSPRPGDFAVPCLLPGGILKVFNSAKFRLCRRWGWWSGDELQRETPGEVNSAFRFPDCKPVSAGASRWLIDLDTIDVSNLNRQFLFQKKHVGRSKSQVAKESVLQFCPEANIIAYHDSIMNPDYNVEFFRRFTLVMNALDNRAARNHVNRMCLAADIPLIESGTAGYLGQVTVIKKGVTECYECQPKPTQKTFPGCTIRNTPSEPIHCIVWAKYLFNCLEKKMLIKKSHLTELILRLPEVQNEIGEPAEAEARALASNEDGEIKRVSTKEWAKSTGYDPVKLFTKLFKDDIRYLLTMDKLWRKRKPPVPLDWAEVQKQEQNISDQQNESSSVLKDQQVLNVRSYADLFSKSVRTLSLHLAKKADGEALIWDKDDPSAMDFVTSAANLRMHVFGMNMKSRFDIKSMAGNIIPAIATTNAVIAGLIVLEGLKILSGKIDQCRTILKEKFAMVAPDVQIEDGKGTILISSEEGETEANNHRKLSDFGIRNGTRLQADDFLQDYTLLINVLHSEDLEKDVEFEVVGDTPERIGPKPSEPASKNISNGSDDGAQPSTSTAPEQDDVVIVDSEDEGTSSNADNVEKKSRKRKLEKGCECVGAKRSHTEQEQDDLMIVESEDEGAASSLGEEESRSH